MTRGVEKKRYYAQVGRSRVEFIGAKYFYDDGQVQSATGIKAVGDGTVDDGELVASGTDAKKYLVRLVAVLSGQIAGGIGTNQQQDETTRSFYFYCDPSFAEEAILKLPNKSLDPGLGFGSFRILRVYRPRRRVLI
ncbi:MAG: hypothetical protein AAF773_07705 [Cyanobacteria bacterium P01_D01_bin.115]